MIAVNLSLHVKDKVFTVRILIKREQGIDLNQTSLLLAAAFCVVSITGKEPRQYYVYHCATDGKSDDREGDIPENRQLDFHQLLAIPAQQ